MNTKHNTEKQTYIQLRKYIGHPESKDRLVIKKKVNE
jgi:hypothetical protein